MRREEVGHGETHVTHDVSRPVPMMRYLRLSSGLDDIDITLKSELHTYRKEVQ